MAAKSKPNEITLTRLYDAPVAAVWGARTDPAQVGEWWGPRGFTLTNHSKDMRPGGLWVYTMHGPDGTDYPNYTLYHEVELYKKLVYDHGATEDHGPLFRVTVLFDERDGQTRMDMTMALKTPEEASKTREFIKKAGGNATWDRLAEYLDEKLSHKNTFVINRSFAVSVDVMFDMWTDPKHFSQWMGPTGSQMEILKGEIKVGGQVFYSMASDKIPTMYGQVDYLKIEKPNLLVYTQTFRDAQGNISRHPFAPTWPEVMMTIVEFHAEDDNQTRVTIKWEPYGDVTQKELDVFIAARGGMTEGWTGSLDRLEAALSDRLRNIA